jgi:hypothetical protein
MRFIRGRNRRVRYRSINVHREYREHEIFIVLCFSQKGSHGNRLQTDICRRQLDGIFADHERGVLADIQSRDDSWCHISAEFHRLRVTDCADRDCNGFAAHRCHIPRISIGNQRSDRPVLHNFARVVGNEAGGFE